MAKSKTEVGEKGSLDRLREFVANYRPAPRCSVCKLPAELIQAVEEGAREGFTYPKLSLFLNAEGHKIGPDTVRKHVISHSKA